MNKMENSPVCVWVGAGDGAGLTTGLKEMTENCSKKTNSTLKVLTGSD